MISSGDLDIFNGNGVTDSYGSPDMSFSSRGYAYLVDTSGVLIVGYNAFVYNSYGHLFGRLFQNSIKLLVVKIAVHD